ncbi:MAG: peptidoglycan DD-metalloendopeptidase family protein [Nitrospinae bacterium]|nr:peptidoglycan DD-metalloendopeptidase family protein [Nitrospinota bacterium]
MIFPKRIVKSTGLLLLTFFFTSCQGSLAPYQLPQGVGVTHVVLSGQTLYRIAQTYRIDVQKLIRVNKIRDAAKVPVGTRLWIPGAYRVLYVSSTDRPQRTVHKKKSVHKPQMKKRAPVKNYLKWPVKGTLTSTFGRRGGRKHDGIDIGASRGTPIYAAADGQVVFSDWGPTGYGLMIIIKHEHHLTTVYAHNSKNWVRKNAWVKRGQKVASVGSTGRSTGPHLHFEVRNDTHPRNPLKYLPSKR